MVPSVALIILTPFDEKVTSVNVCVFVTDKGLDTLITFPESSVREIEVEVS
jgi:hypothetical protein